MLGIEKEMAVFAVACLDGVLVSLVYTAIRVFRRLIRHNLFWLSIEDLFFWLGTGLFLFSELYRTCSGSIRWYFVLGIFLGGVLSAIFVEKVVKKYIDKSEKTR